MTNFAARRIELPASALRDGVRFRIRTVGTAGFDNWFVDDVAVFTSYGSPQMQAAIAQNLGDPVTFGPGLAKMRSISTGLMTLYVYHSIRH